MLKVHKEWAIFHTKWEKMTNFKVLNLKKENLDRFVLWYFSCTIPRRKFKKGWKNHQAVFSKVEKRNFKVYFWSVLFDRV